MIPAGMKDMSEIRQVPNHQEFYANLDSGLNIIIEINEVIYFEMVQGWPIDLLAES